MSENLSLFFVVPKVYIYIFNAGCECVKSLAT